MKYFKNTELAKLYNVSEKSVRNWIDAAAEGKLGLQLYEEKGRTYVANISKNTRLIEELVEKGKKYRNSRGFKTVTPSREFYKVYNSKQVFDIISNLDAYREIPHQYSYFNGGATLWDMYTKKLADEQSPNLLTNTIDMLNLNTAYLDRIVGSSRVNIVDLGLGNAYPVRQLLDHFVELGKLNRYIGVDVSHDMIDIAERNIKDWFGDKVNFEGHVRDVNYERFEDLLAKDSFGEDTPVTNIVLYLGSTIAAFRKPSHSLYTVHESMGKNDLLVFSMKLDTLNSRRYFDFGTKDEAPLSLYEQDRFILDMLNIDDSTYDVQQYFDETKMERRIQVQLKVALSIEFELNGQPRTVSFDKGEAILLWQHKHQNALKTIEQFDISGFELLQATKSKDRECIMLISKIKGSQEIG